MISAAKPVGLSGLPFDFAVIKIQIYESAVVREIMSFMLETGYMMSRYMINQQA